MSLGAPDVSATANASTKSASSNKSDVNDANKLKGDTMTSTSLDQFQTLYLSMSDSTLIDLRQQLKADYQRARQFDDAQAMTRFEQRLRLVEDVLCSRGKTKP